MQQKFWICITRLGQGPRILLWILSIHYLPQWCNIGLVYDTILNNPFAVLLLVGLLASYMFGAILKLLIFKPRPLPYPIQGWRDRIDASSFPSIHTSNATIIVLLRTWRGHQSLLIGADHLEIFALVLPVVIICAGIGLSRIELKKHFPIDVWAGMIFGIGIVALLGLAYTYGYFHRW